MKKSNKKSLESRGIIVSGRATPTPGAQTHADKRRANRSTQKQRLKLELRKETARSRGPFDIQPQFLVSRHGLKLWSNRLES